MKDHLPQHVHHLLGHHPISKLNRHCEPNRQVKHQSCISFITCHPTSPAYHLDRFSPSLTFKSKWVGETDCLSPPGFQDQASLGCTLFTTFNPALEFVPFYKSPLCANHQTESCLSTWNHLYWEETIFQFDMRKQSNTPSSGIPNKQFCQ